MGNRRDIWREFMGRFEPSADPHDAVERGFYVPRPGRSLAEDVAERFDVKPAASHLLVGGVGSGKTTQLLVARDRLEATGDVKPIYVDASIRVEPNSMEQGDLLALVGLQLGLTLDADQMTEPSILGALNLFEQYLYHGQRDRARYLALGGAMQRLPEALVAHRRHHVLLIDSLDRMSNLGNFATLIESSLTALRSCGIGILLVGPLTALYGIQRTTLDRFDRTWHLPAVDTQNDAQGQAFLFQLLQTRDTHGLLTEASTHRLVALSGGVLRDLVALTQAAGEEAYVDGAEHVEVRHVEIVAEEFGRKHLFAIDSAQLEVLQRVRIQGTFVQTSEKDLALLATRRVLEYTNGQVRFAVHPTIEPLLAQMAGETP